MAASLVEADKNATILESQHRADNSQTGNRVQKNTKARPFEIALLTVMQDTFMFVLFRDGNPTRYDFRLRLLRPDLYIRLRL